MPKKIYESTTERVAAYRARTADAFDRLQLRPRAGTRAGLQRHADRLGFGSITRLVEEIAAAKKISLE